MNFELFLARRLSRSKLNQNYYSGPITNICVFAICVSVFIMIITVSSGLGLKKTIKQNIREIESDIQISKINNKKELDPIYITENKLKNISEIKGVDKIYPIVKKSTIISNKQNLEGIILKGIGETYKLDVIKNHIIRGSQLSIEKRNEILISSHQAKKLELKVGDSCLLYFLSDNNNIQKRKFFISGIYEMANQKFNEIYAFAKINEIQKINRWENDKLTNYEITLINDEENKHIVQQINNILPYNLLAQSIENRFYAIFNWVKLFDKNIAFILVIMCFICIINMTNSLLILVLERLKMIGILKSYGCPNSSVVKIFLYNSFRISLLGITLGNIIGLFFCFIQQNFQIIQLDPTSYFVNYLPIVINIEILCLINLITFLTIQTSMIIPYYIIHKLSPSKILKIN